MLYIIATPIGNLRDITLRALDVLKEVDLLLCEDTRVTKKLLSKYNIKVPVLSYHEHSGRSKTDKIIKELKQGKNIGLVTDAGTPGLSDPGNKLVAEIIKASEEEIKIIPIPGPSALTALISVAGINLQKFLFLGFPPHKKGRQKFFQEVAESKIPVIYFESPYRFLKNLEFLKGLVNKRVIVGRELTKKFEEVIRGDIEEVLGYFKDKKVRGEFVIIVY